MWWISECYGEVINQVKEHPKSNPSLLSDYKVNEDKHEVDRTSADEDQIDDVTFLETPLIPTRSKEETIMKVEIWKKIVRKWKRMTQRK